MIRNLMLKRFILLAICICTCLPWVFGQDDEEIGGIVNFEQNKHYPRVNVIGYDNEKDIQKLDYSKSSSYKNLNGEWLFKLNNGSELLERKDIDIDSLRPLEWGKMQVPGNWVVNGKVAESHALKNLLSIQSVENPIGLYFTEIEIDEEWKDKNIYFQIGAAKSAYTVWVNGKYVGYAEDSKTPSDFDITDYIVWNKKKTVVKNNILIQVQSVSEGSLLEQKLPLAFNGIERDVVMYSKPQANISDFSVMCDYRHNDGSGKIELSVELENKKKKGEYYVEALLLNDKGKEVDRFGKWATFEKRIAVDVQLNRELAKVERWDEYNPYLYTLIIRLKDQTMETIEVVGTKVGFRNIDFSKGVLTINGNEVIIKGVVRCDFSTKDITFDKERFRKELQLMKSHNINAIRAAYAPQHSDFYQLCDEYGIYVFNEANIQPYRLDKTLSTNKDYSAAFVARARNMYERDKNHCCIVAWSLGDAEENGICFEDAYKFLKYKDKIRPVVFGGTETGSNTDFVFSKNKTVDDLVAFSEKRQLQAMIISEYGNTEGNSFGSTYKMWQTIKNKQMLQGGFIAYWNEIEVYDKESKKDITIHGLVDKNGNSKPYLSEIKKIYGCIEVEYTDKTKGHFRVTNHHEYKNLKDFRFEYTIFSNLKPMVISGDIPASAAPGESCNFELQIPQLKAYAGEEYFIRFSLKQRNDTKAYKRGYEYDFAEFGIKMPTFKKQELRPYEKTEVQMSEHNAIEKVDAIEVDELNIKNTGNSLQVLTTDMEFVFDLVKGEISSLKHDGKQVFTSSPKMSFWRQPTPNEIENKYTSAHWENIGLNNLTRTLKGVTFKQNDKYTVNIDVVSSYSNYQGVKLFDVMQTIVVYCTGDVLIENEIIATDIVQNVPKVGMQFEMDNSFSDIEWFGLNTESYSDRKLGAKVGTYTANTDNFCYQYEQQQASGNHTDTRWLSVGNNDIGIFFDGMDSTFDFSISKADNQNYIISFDHKNSGIGNGLLLPIDDDLLLTDKKYSFNVRFVAYDKTNHSPFDFRMIQLPNIESNILSMPLITKTLQQFDSPMNITLSSIDNAEIRYTLDGSEPTEKSALYKQPFTIEKSTLVKARTFKKGFTPSLVAQEQFNYYFIDTITFENKPNTPYNKNIATTLLDGLYGSITDLEQRWLGFSGSDFVATVKLLRPIDLNNVMLSFAHVPDNWVFAPKSIEIMTSEDGITYSEPYIANYTFDAEDEKQNVSQLISLSVPAKNSKVMYVKIVARSIKKIPMWHAEAKGLRPWIMIDEIQIQE